MAIKVLVVDDERAISDSVCMVLEGSGYQVRGTYSAEEALAVASDFAPDVLLTDVLMPGMNGFELALRIKARHPQCKLLLFSGQAATVELARKFAGEFSQAKYRYELLPKPLHPTKLLEKVEQALIVAA